MGKVDKKKRKLQDRIDTLQEELRNSLTKKDSSTKEIDVASHQRKIQDLQKELNSL
jgi:predicted  nucleic acid-binding Zn-ribbon protein